MRVLIVGCGYVGVPLGAELSREGHQVFGLRRTSSAEQSLLAAGITPLVADITQPVELARLPSVYDWVINCVASSGGSADDYRRLYLQGTRNLLDWLAPSPPRKFVYTSSTSVYGQADGSWVDETSPTQPAAETAMVLLETERVLLDAARQRQFPAIILRLAAIYGPDRGYWFKQFLSGTARLEGSGGRFLNMIHRDDVVGAVLAALERAQPAALYNAVDDEPVTQLAFFQWLASTLGKEAPPSEPVAPDARERKRGITNKRVSNQKLKTELQYRPRFPTFRQGVDFLITPP